MSIKVHCLYSHLNQFPRESCSYGEEQGKGFHQDLGTMEHKYQCRWNGHMMTDYCWGGNVFVLLYPIHNIGGKKTFDVDNSTSNAVFE